RLAALTGELGLAGQVRFLGYVPDEDISALYRRALVLVMPTFFGPTNIPYLEAWSLGCPVITSDVRGLPEQVGDAGLLVDPRDEGALAEAIWRLRSDEALRRSLVERGRRKVAEWTPRRRPRAPSCPAPGRRPDAPWAGRSPRSRDGRGRRPAPRRRRRRGTRARCGRSGRSSGPRTAVRWKDRGGRRHPARAAGIAAP